MNEGLALSGLRPVHAQAALLLVVSALMASGAQAQQQPPRQQQPIEIRGEVPTPQIVTVRPREVPAFARRVLVPDFYDHDFWPSILPGYDLVPRRMIMGAAVVSDTTTPPATQPRAPGAGLALPDTTRLVNPPVVQPPPPPPAAGTTAPAEPTRGVPPPMAARPKR